VVQSDDATEPYAHRARVDEVRGTELLEAAQALELRRVDG
jgi:hypothetical protein